MPNIFSKKIAKSSASKGFLAKLGAKKAGLPKLPKLGSKMGKNTIKKY